VQRGQCLVPKLLSRGHPVSVAWRKFVVDGKKELVQIRL
jgi:hypothetical protein